MKTKAQKQTSIERSEELLGKSEALVLFDFTKVKTADLRVLRQELAKSGNPLFIVKKRLLEIALKKLNIPFDAESIKTSVGAVFSSSLESAAASVHKFFKALEKAKKIEGQKMLGGVDLKGKALISAADVIAIGALPPREVLLAQLAAMLAAPLKGLLYVLDQKAKQENG